MRKKTAFLCLFLCLSFLKLPHCSAASETMQGYISAAVAVANIDGYGVEARFLTSDCQQHVFTIKQRVNIDNTSYRPSTYEGCEQLAAFIKDRFAEIQIQETQITSIFLSDGGRTVYNAEYNPVSGYFSGMNKPLPIFDHHGEFKPYLDENHVYDIEVHSFAVNITKMHAKNNMETVAHISASNSVQNNFLHTLWMDFETTATTAICKGTLSANGRISQEFEEPVYDGYGSVDIQNLPNETKLYTVSFRMETENGTPLSPTYTYTHQIEAIPILYGYIVNALPVSDINGTHLEVLIRHSDQSETIYKINSSISINGNSCKPWLNESIWTPLIGNLIKAAVSEGCLQAIYYETTPKEVTDAEYNSVLKQFANIDNALPVFYEYGEYLPYLDENHTYTLDVYSYAVNITDMTAKNGWKTIFHVDLYQSVQNDFLLSLGGSFEADTTTAIVKTRLCDTNGNTLQEMEENVYDTYGYIGFRALPNQNKNYTVSFWLEDAEGKRISLLYTFKYAMDAVPVYTGYMDATAIVSDINGEGIEFRITNPQDGDRVFRCAYKFYLNGISFRITYSNVEMLKDSIQQLTQIECMCDENGNVSVIRSAVMHRPGKDCRVSDAVVYKDSFEAEVQFEETYTGTSALVLIALYDENSKMTGWTFETVEVPADKSESVSVSAPIDASERYKNGKVFLWESMLGPCS